MEANTHETERWQFSGWDEAKAFVDSEWPNAIHAGMGYWKVQPGGKGKPITAEIFYSIGSIEYRAKS